MTQLLYKYIQKLECMTQMTSGITEAEVLRSFT